MKYIIITGGPGDGFAYIGPFDTRDEAVEYADAEGHETWWTAEIEAPKDTGA